MDEELPDIRPTHVWVRRTLFIRGEHSTVTNEIHEFGDNSDQGMGVKFIEILLDLGHELGIYEDFSPIKMDIGRYIIQSPKGFSVIEIDPAWTEDQMRQMELIEESIAPKLDMKTWGSIFTVDEEAR